MPGGVHQEHCRNAGKPVSVPDLKMVSDEEGRCLECGAPMGRNDTCNDCRCFAAGYAAGKADGARAENERWHQLWAAGVEARTMLGEALYPGFKGDSPPGTANSLWAFAKEAAARLAARRGSEGK